MKQSAMQSRKARCGGLTLGSCQIPTLVLLVSSLTRQWEKMKNHKLMDWNKDMEITYQLSSQTPWAAGKHLLFHGLSMAAGAPGMERFLFLCPCCSRSSSSHFSLTPAAFFPPQSCCPEASLAPYLAQLCPVLGPLELAGTGYTQL